MMFIDKNVLEMLRKEYRPGDKVECVCINDQYLHIPAGTKGVVLCVDAVGTIHVIWGNGASLGCVYGVDSIRKI